MIQYSWLGSQCSIRMWKLFWEMECIAAVDSVTQVEIM